MTVMNDGDDDKAYHFERRQTIETLARVLPDNVIKQAFGHVPRAVQALYYKQCPSLSKLAHSALFTHLILETPERVDRLMQCYPVPDTIAGYVEYLEIPGALRPGAREYITKLIQLSLNINKLKVGLRDTDDDKQYIVDPATPHRIRTLIVGGAHENRDSDIVKAPVIKLSELDRFPNLTTLHWWPVDPRLGSVQHLLREFDRRYPDLKFLLVPWSDNLDATPWCCPPRFPNLKHLTFRFNHHSQINVTEFVKCLRFYYERGIDVQIGSGCGMEIAKWLDKMYYEIYQQSITKGWAADDMFRWVIQNNYRWHLLKLTDLKLPSMKQALYEAIRRVDCSDGGGLRIEVDLTHGELPDILKRNVEHLRLQIPQKNIHPNRIREILTLNPRLKVLFIAMHIVHHGGSYDGNCTVNKIPLIPKQDVARHSGQRCTIPGFELKYALRRRDEAPISQIWRWYNHDRRGRHVAKHLPQLNVFDIAEADWTDQLRERYYKWENEIKGWFDLNKRLLSIAIILNTDVNKFGTMEAYWCSCNEKEYS